ncbi:MAG: hypothetical protein WCI51_08990 [Lentisphaerota bacterium]
MKNYIKHLLLIALLALTVAGNGEVFSLWPNAGRGNGTNAETALNPKNIWSEPVTINDVKLELNVGLIDMNPEDLVALLMKLFPNAKFATNSNSMLVIIKQEDGSEKRLLLVSLGANTPVIQFSMTVPAKFPENFTWPACLPLPGDSAPVKYMYFSKRDAYYGEFKTGTAPAQGLEEIARKISHEGWAATVKRTAGDRDNTGEIFMKSKPLAVMLVNFDKSGSGFVFTRPIK